MPSPRRRSSALLALFALLTSLPAAAHTVGLSRGQYHVSGSSVEVELQFAQPELARIVPGLDVNADGLVSEGELAQAGPALGSVMVGGLEVRSSTRPCAGELREASRAEPDGVVVRATYVCPGEETAGTVRLALLSSLSVGHRHLAAVVSNERNTTGVLHEESPELRLAASPEARGNARLALSLLRLGVEHILTGYDHLVFLLGLVLVGGRLRSLLVVVTAFTVAHSISLGLAALGVWAPSPGLVEPAIALSIAYVGIENWFVRDASRRWLLTFPFGLIHGFGFAGALAEVALPSGQVPLALASFNIGVEAGQLAVLAVVLPALLWLGRRPWFARQGVKVLSAGIALAGFAWFVARIA